MNFLFFGNLKFKIEVYFRFSKLQKNGWHSSTHIYVDTSESNAVCINDVIESKQLMHQAILLFGCLFSLYVHNESPLSSDACGTTVTPLIILLHCGPGARFSKAPETFRARKAIFRSSESKNGQVYTPETSCMKGTSFHL